MVWFVIGCFCLLIWFLFDLMLLFVCLACFDVGVWCLDWCLF